MSTSSPKASDRRDQHGTGGDGHAGHSHTVNTDANRKYLGAALALIAGFMALEVVVGILAQSLALISDAGHMLTDAMALVLALWAAHLATRPARGRWTYGFKRAEVLSAQANGLTLLLLAAYFIYESVHRLISPPEVQGLLVTITAVVGIAVNVAAAWLISKANRTSLNVEGAFQHILNDLYAFIATAISGIVVLLTGWTRADAVAALIVAALMIKAGYGLVRESGRIFLEAAPAGLDPDHIGPQMAAHANVLEVHDLHIWEVTTGMPALSAHVLVDPAADCHQVRRDLETLLDNDYHIQHTTLQADHGPDDADPTTTGEDCADPHGPRHQTPRTNTGPDAGRLARTPPPHAGHTPDAAPEPVPDSRGSQ